MNAAQYKEFFNRMNSRIEGIDLQIKNAPDAQLASAWSIRKKEAQDCLEMLADIMGEDL